MRQRHTKICTTCGARKPPSEFAKTGKVCFGCQAARRAARDAARYEAQKSDPLYRERKAKNAKRWYADHRQYASERGKKYNARPEVKQHRQERDAERRATDPEFIEQNKRRSREWHYMHKLRISEQRREKREAQRLANGDGRKRRSPGDRANLKYASGIWQPPNT